MALKIDKQAWVIGAINRCYERRGLNRVQIVTLLQERARLPRERAKQLASHWLRRKFPYDLGVSRRG